MEPTLLETHILFEAPTSSIETLFRFIGTLGHNKSLPQPLDKMNALTAWTDFFNPVTLEAHFIDKRGVDKRYPKLDSLRTLLQAIADKVPDVECWGTFSYSADKRDPTEIDYFLVRRGTITVDSVNVAALRHSGGEARCLLHLKNGKPLLYLYAHNYRCVLSNKKPKINGLHSTDEVFRELGSLFSPQCSQFEHTAIDVETGERTSIEFSDPQDVIRSITISDPSLFNPRATLYGRNYANARCRTAAWRSDENPLEMLIGHMQAECKISERRRWRVTWEYPVSEDIVSLLTTSQKRDAINSCCINQERSLEMIKGVYPAHIHKMCADGGEETTAEWISMLLEDARGELKRKRLAKRFNLVLEDGIKL